MRSFSLIGAVVFATLTGGCGSKDKSDSTDDPGADLIGTWKNTCGTDDAATETDKTYDLSTKTFTATKASVESHLFSDAECTVKAFSVILESTYEVTGDATTPAGATNTTFAGPASIAITLQSDDYVAYFNGTAEGSTKTCGGGFEKDTAKTVTLADCKGSDLESAFSKVYGIYKVDGTTLFEGDIGDDGTATDGSTEAKRPTVLKTRGLTKS